MTVHPDVLVVGGGPGGSTVAGLLAARGWRVHLLDRATFPRPKPCGECVNPGAVTLLRRLGLLDVVEALQPRPLLGWDVWPGDAETGPGRRPARGRFGPAVGTGLSVTRSRLDAALLDEARRRGVQVEEGVQVRRVAERAGPVAVETRERDGSPGRRSARVLVGADGLRSVVGRALDAPARRPRLRKLSLTAHVRGLDLPKDRGRLVLTDRGTLGLAPVAEGLWNATAVVSPDRDGEDVSRDPAAFLLDFLHERLEKPAGRPALAEGPWASGPFDRPVRQAVGDGIVLVGDAAGYYDPLTGQGIYRALRSAELAAGVIHQALRQGTVGEQALKPYSRRLARSVSAGRRVQKLVEAVVSRPRIRRVVLERLARSRGAVDALIRVTGDARPARSLLRPSVWMPLLLAPGSQDRSSPDQRSRGRRGRFDP